LYASYVTNNLTHARAALYPCRHIEEEVRVTGCQRAAIQRHFMNHKRLYIGDLAPEVTENDLETLFGEVGSVESIKLMRSTRGTSRGFAFMEMATPEAARDAIKRFNGYDLKGYRLIVYAVPPQSRPREQSH
jgi:RNA recognition motif-containing protein